MDDFEPLQCLYILKDRNRIQNTIRGKKKGKRNRVRIDRPPAKATVTKERVLWVGGTRGPRKEGECRGGACAATALERYDKSSLRVKELDKSRGGRKCSRRMDVLK